MTPASPNIRRPTSRKISGWREGGAFVGEARGFSGFDDLDGEELELALEVEDASFFRGEGRFGGGRELCEAKRVGEGGMDNRNGKIPEAVE